MLGISLIQLVNTGIHLGYEVNEWNPKILPYIHVEREGIHILDLVQISKLLHKAAFYSYCAAKNKQKFLFVGTKLEVSVIVEQEAKKCNSYYINKRWLGGMLTNWETLKTRINRLKTLEQQDKDDILKKLPKKEEVIFKKELKRLQYYLNGVKYMTTLPDVMIVIDQSQELAAINEARSLKIPIISILGTDCNPNIVDMPIPINMNSIPAIKLILETIRKNIQKGQK